MSGLTFTEDAARHLERLYLTTDVVAQRAETMKQLALSPGERRRQVLREDARDDGDKQARSPGRARSKP